MGADSVVLCYGVRYALGADSELTDEDLEIFETGRDPRMVAASKVGLKSYFGRDTEGGEYFLLVGMLLGSFGSEGKPRAQFPDAVLSDIVARTRRLLKTGGLVGEPELHVQLEAQY